MGPLLLVAASGLAREALSVLRRLDRTVIGLLDDEPRLHGTSVSGVDILGPLETVQDHPEAEILICAGRGHSRRLILDRLSALGVGVDRYATVVDPSVIVGQSCSFGPGSIALAGSVLTADVSVGAHVVLMPRVVLTHDDLVQDYATLCAGVTLGGNVQIGPEAYLGMASSVRERCVIGTESVLGMGSVLLQDLPDGETWAGVPAHSLNSSVSALSTESLLP